MRFNDLDQQMRVFETAHDVKVDSGVFMIARLDGRNFTKLTKETLDIERPFDVRFRDAMCATTEHLMNTGFRIIYGYFQSDEISLLFHPQDVTFERKMRKLNSVLAAEASVKFYSIMENHAVFDCRISQIPDPETVSMYFRWRNEDAYRNARGAHLYWALRKSGLSGRAAQKKIDPLSIEEMEAMLLSEFSVDFAARPLWEKRGGGLFWENYQKEAQNPKTGETVLADRKRLVTEYELPQGEDYSTFIKKLIQDNQE